MRGATAIQSGFKAVRIVRYRIESNPADSIRFEFIKFGIDKFEVSNRLRFAIELTEWYIVDTYFIFKGCSILVGFDPTCCKSWDAKLKTCFKVQFLLFFDVAAT